MCSPVAIPWPRGVMASFQNSAKCICIVESKWMHVRLNHKFFTTQLSKTKVI